jgi:hypothetical protein
MDAYHLTLLIRALFLLGLLGVVVAAGAHEAWRERRRDSTADGAQPGYAGMQPANAHFNMPHPEMGNG